MEFHHCAYDKSKTKKDECYFKPKVVNLLPALFRGLLRIYGQTSPNMKLRCSVKLCLGWVFITMVSNKLIVLVGTLASRNYQNSSL